MYKGYGITPNALLIQPDNLGTSGILRINYLQIATTVEVIY